MDVHVSFVKCAYWLSTEHFNHILFLLTVSSTSMSRSGTKCCMFDNYKCPCLQYRTFDETRFFVCMFKYVVFYFSKVYRLPWWRWWSSIRWTHPDTNIAWVLTTPWHNSLYRFRWRSPCQWCLPQWQTVTNVLYSIYLSSIQYRHIGSKCHVSIFFECIIL